MSNNMAYNLVKAKYTKMTESGKVKTVTESYLVDCLSKTEGEARIIEELSSLYSDLQIKSIADTKISEIFINENADRFYLVNVAFITIDEKTAVEKRSITQILVQANDFDSAVESFKGGMKGTMADFEIISVAETPYMGVYPAKLSNQ